MKETTLQDIKAHATSAGDQGLKWHYHLMSPTCNLNKSSKYAIFYEQEGSNNQLVNYSDKAEMDFSKDLATLLHGTKVMNDSPSGSLEALDDKTTAIIELAKNLTEQNIEWHHHILFPNCMFNNNAPRFTLMLENPNSEDALTAISDSEPKDALSHIEKLFYKT